MERISKIFVVNLRDKLHRWEKFQELNDPRLERFDAIDTRTNQTIPSNFTLKLNITGLAQQIYFSQAKGAIGIYLSFYSIWKKMVAENINVALILEDDADINSVSSYLSQNKLIPSNEYDFIQLGKRCNEPWIEDFTENFDGMEAHVLTKRGAEILLNTTHDISHFNGVVKVKPFGDGARDVGGYENLSIFKNEPPQKWINNSITCAADKIVGFCANANHSIDKRLRIKLEPCIDLYYQQVKSDIIDAEKCWWFMNEAELLDLIASPQFKYWET